MTLTDLTGESTKKSGEAATRRGGMRALTGAIGRSPVVPQLGIAIVAILISEAMPLVGAPRVAAAPILVLATFVAVHSGRRRMGAIVAVAMLAYLILRSTAEDFGPGLVVAAIGVGAAAPALALILRKRVAKRTRAVVRNARRVTENARAKHRSALEAAEADRWSILDGLEAVVWEPAADGEGIVFRSAHAGTLLGYAQGADERANRFGWDLFHPDDVRRIRNAIEAVAEDGKPRQLEYRIRARDGFLVWMKDRICALPGSTPERPRVRGMAVDISTRKAVEEDLHREKERYRSLFEGVPVGLYRMTPQGEFLVANSALVSMMGYSNHQSFYATSASDLYLDPMDRWRWQNAMVHVHGVRSFELPCRRADGSLLWVRNTAKAVRSENGGIEYYEGFVEDITDAKRAEAAEASAGSRVSVFAEQSLVGIYIVQDDAIVYANPKVSEIFGHAHQELLELPSALDVVAEEHRSRVSAYFQEALGWDVGEPLNFRGITRDGEVVEVEAHCSRTTFDDRPAILATVLDVTERKATEEKLFHAAFHDPLTNLPNRILFMERLEHAFQRQKRGRQFAVLFVDLNRFKAVNDSLGHAAGDDLLRVIGDRLPGCVRPGDTVARFGGDEFAMLIEDIAEVDEATEIADRVRNAISETVVLKGHEVQVGGSIGIALSSAGYSGPEEILRDADLAMYRAKGAGASNVEIFDQVMHGEALERIRMESDLETATERGDFHLHFQPLVNLVTGEVDGVEALVRWTHAERGEVSPATFIPLAEQIGVIVPLGRQVLRMACRQAAEWQERFPRERPLSVSVNLSAKQIRGSAIVEDVRQVLDETGLAPGSLKLEITEGLILEDQRAAAHMLTRLRDLGVRIFLDDFGTGYSSLGYLHNLPVDTLKIDRTFVSDLEAEDGDGPHLVRTLVNVAHNLGMEVIAEGAETEVHVRRLRELGCEFAQGHYFAPAVPAEEIEALLEMGPFPLPEEGEQRLKVVGQG